MQNGTKPVFTHQVVIGLDKPMHDALAWCSANIYPKKSRSELCREAIFQLIATAYPQAFKNKSNNSVTAE